MNDPDWFYNLDGVRNGPVSGARLKVLRKDSTLSDDTLVWTEGMNDWRPFEDCQTAAHSAPTIPNDVPTSLPIWLSFSGWGTIFLGVLCILSIIGIAIGGLLLLCGTSLLRLRTTVLEMVNNDGPANLAWRPLLGFAKSFTWLIIGGVVTVLFFWLFYVGVFTSTLLSS